MKYILTLGALTAASLFAADLHTESLARPARWPVERIQAWRAAEGWRIGCNYLPATAINQHEMWSAETWDPATITRELDLARDTGLNTLRVYLHDRTFEQDPEGLLRRMDDFLGLCASRGIKPLFVFFDDCWLMPSSVPGWIPAPRPGTHNSGWLQSPGSDLVRTYPTNGIVQQRLRTYVQTTLRRFANDPRVLGWDLFNEPGNRAHRRFDGNGAEIAGEQREEPAHEGDLALLRDVFAWAREVDPDQPLTSGVWQWFRADQHPIAREQLEQSDFISFHHYGSLASITGVVAVLRTQAGDRPILCTEYMARSTGSTFEQILPFLASSDIGAIHWGFVEGRSQTRYSWGSWRKPENEQSPWFHDLYRRDGTPYREPEITLIRRISAEKRSAK